MRKLQIALVKEEVKYMAMWRSTYPYKFAALIHATNAQRLALLHEACLVQDGLASAKALKSTFWTH